MKLRLVLSLFIVFFVLSQSNGQNGLSFQKAKFKESSHVDCLTTKTNYPIESLKNNEEGFVIISFRITFRGKDK